MGRRLVLFSESGEQRETLLAFAQSLGYKVIIDEACDEIWQLSSSIADYLWATGPFAEAVNKRTVRSLNNCGFVSFADLGPVSMGYIWRCTALAVNGAVFTWLLQGMRLTGATFSDWRPGTERRLASITGISGRLLATLSDGGINELDVLKRLGIEELRDIHGLGPELHKELRALMPRLKSAM